jgi:hypothetical protein
MTLIANEAYMCKYNPSAEAAAAAAEVVAGQKIQFS